ncbi:MAG: phosphoglycerate kinase [Elusimicrobia bacterium]|nr:phosphoglycerate kinase [Elusimicrobiota bacterium]
MRLQELNIIAGQRVLLRVDYNVALDAGRVAEPKRIDATLPTLKWLLEKKASVIICSHLGRPNGWEPKYSLRPVVDELNQILRREKLPVTACSLWDKPYPSPELAERAKTLQPGEILVLENLRFHAGEEKNDADLARGLAQLGEVFVQEAFGALHRAHASTDALPRLMAKRAFGFLVAKELDTLGALLTNPSKPFVVLLGGVKVSDKIGAIENLLNRGVDKILIGGALAYTFLKSQGHEVGNSPVEEKWVPRVKELLARQNGSSRIVLRKDHWIAQGLDRPQGAKVTENPGVPSGWEGLDVGPKTLDVFSREINNAKTIFWNGPVGVIEVPPFDRGSSALARLIAERTKAGALTVLGGGDTIHAVSKAGVPEGSFSHVSTGGGATLEFLEGKTLPGVAAIAG